MITNFKIFETANSRKLKKGDYVLCHEENFGYENKETEFFINSTIGVYIDYAKSATNKYCVEYYDVPKEFKSDIRINSENKYVRYYKRDEIQYWSKNKEDLESFSDLIINTKKYNL